MSEAIEWPSPKQPIPLTIRRTLSIVAISLVIGAAAAISLFLAIYTPSLEHEITLGNEYPGSLGTIVGVPLGAAAGFLAAVLVVALGLRGRTRADGFIGTYAGVLFLLIPIVLYQGVKDGAFGNAGALGHSSVVASVIGVSMLWALPAVESRLLRRRWFAVILGSTLVLVIVTNLILGTTTA